MIRGSGRLARPDWTDRSTHRQKSRPIGPFRLLRRRNFRPARTGPRREISPFFKALPPLPRSPFPPEPEASRPEIRSHFARRKEFCHRDSGSGFSRPDPGPLRPLHPPRIGLRLSGAARRGYRCVRKCHVLSCRAVSPRLSCRPEPPIPQAAGNAARESLQHAECSYNVRFVRSQPAGAIVHPSRRHPRRAGRRSHDGLRRQADHRRVSAARAAGVGELVHGLGLRKAHLIIAPERRVAQGVGAL